MHYRCMHPGDDESESLALVMRGFDRFVRSDFSEEGAEEFKRSAYSLLVGHPPGHAVSVAESDGRLVGVVDVKEAMHISLFFVEPDVLGRGIGRGLLNHAISRARAAKPGLTRLTVNSSPWAVPVYQALGFVRTGEESEQHGIRFVPMELQLDIERGLSPAPKLEDGPWGTESD